MVNVVAKLGTTDTRRSTDAVNSEVVLHDSTIITVVAAAVKFGVRRVRFELTRARL